MEKHEKIGIYDGIKGWCGALGMIGIGVLVYVGPAEIAEELPRHREIGIAIGAFGVVFAFALLFHGTEFGFRMQSLLLCVGGAFLAVLIGFGIGPPVHAAWRLAADGIETRATVERVKMLQTKNGTTYRYVVTYDGHRATIRMKSGARRGAQVPVVYLPDEPDTVLHGRKDDSFPTLVDKTIGRWWAILGAVLAVTAALLALVKLKHFLLGRGDG